MRPILECTASGFLALLSAVATAEETVYRWPVRCVLETYTPIPDTDPPLYYVETWPAMGPMGTGYSSYAAVMDDLPWDTMYHGLGHNPGDGYEILGSTLDDAINMPDGWGFCQSLGLLLAPRYGFDNESVLFTASTTNNPDDPTDWNGGGLFVASSIGELRALAVTGQPVVGGYPGETFKGNYNYVAASPSGHVAMYANSRNADGTTDYHNELLVRGNTDEVEIYWRRTDIAPGFPDGTTLSRAVLSWLATNNGGDLIFNTLTTGPWGTVAALYTDRGYGPELITHSGMWVPDMLSWFFDSSFDHSWIDDSGRVAVSAIARNPNGPPWWSIGIWVAEPGEDLRTLLLLPVPVPVFGPDATFDSRGAEHLDNRGHIVAGGSLLYEESGAGDGAAGPPLAVALSHDSSIGGAQPVDGSSHGRPPASEYTFWRMNLETEHLLPLAYPGQRYGGAT